MLIHLWVNDDDIVTCSVCGTKPYNNTKGCVEVPDPFDPEPDPNEPTDSQLESSWESQSE